MLGDGRHFPRQYALIWSVLLEYAGLYVQSLQHHHRQAAIIALFGMTTCVRSWLSRINFVA